MGNGYPARTNPADHAIAAWWKSQAVAMHLFAQLVTASAEQCGIQRPAGTAVRAREDPPRLTSRYKLSFANLRHMPSPRCAGGNLMGTYWSAISTARSRGPNCGFRIVPAAPGHRPARLRHRMRYSARDRNRHRRMADPSKTRPQRLDQRYARATVAVTAGSGIVRVEVTDRSGPGARRSCVPLAVTRKGAGGWGWWRSWPRGGAGGDVAGGW